jgi:hypothetical protein
MNQRDLVWKLNIMSMKDMQGYIVNNNSTTIIIIIKVILLMAFGFFINLDCYWPDWHAHQKDNHEKMHIIWTNCTAFDDISERMENCTVF